MKDIVASVFPGTAETAVGALGREGPIAAEGLLPTTMDNEATKERASVVLMAREWSMEGNFFIRAFLGDHC